MSTAVAPGHSFQPLTLSGGVSVCVEALVKRFVVRRSWMQTLRHPRSNSYVDALDQVDFEAREGEVVALLGANGAGKTTLLKILSTLVTPDGGSVRVGGLDVVRDAAAVRRILTPVAADERSLDWRLSARENLRFFGVLQQFRGSALHRRIEEVLSAVELLDTAEKLVGSFSSGMRQRLLIARALLSRPRVLVLDEPTRSLDPLSARAFRAFVRRELVNSQGCTILLATHDPEEALDLSDRVSILHRGKVLATGTPAQLARSCAGERYRIWTRTPDHPGLAAALRGSPGSTARSWDEQERATVVEFALPAGMTDTAGMLSLLIGGGAHVARFEKVPLNLPELMERVLSRARCES